MKNYEDCDIAPTSATVMSYSFTLTQDSHGGESAVNNDSILFDLEKKDIPPATPDWFLDAFADVEAGREVDLDTALNESPPEE